MTSKVDAAVAELLAEIQNRYGQRAEAIYRVDRNKVLDQRDASDAELVVLLTGENWRMLDEQRALGELTFEVLLKHDVHIRAWPVAARAWQDPGCSEHPALVEELREHAREFMVPA